MQPLNPLLFDAWAVRTKFYRQLVLFGVSLALACTFARFVYGGGPSSVATWICLVLALVCLAPSIYLAWAWGSHAYSALRQRVTGLETIIALFTILALSSLGFDHMSMKYLLFMLLGASVAAIAYLIHFLTSPRACREEIDAAHAGYFDD
jgi:hypothetical protein